MKYTIQKIFGSYSICVESDYTTMTYYDVQKDIIDIIKQLEQENQKYKEVIDKAIDLLDNYQNNLYSKKARETLDDDIEMALDILKEVE